MDRLNILASSGPVTKNIPSKDIICDCSKLPNSNTIELFKLETWLVLFICSVSRVNWQKMGYFPIHLFLHRVTKLWQWLILGTFVGIFFVWDLFWIVNLKHGVIWEILSWPEDHFNPTLWSHNTNNKMFRLLLFLSFVNFSFECCQQICYCFSRSDNCPLR